MPLYAYLCRKCGASRDLLVRDGDAPCPCGGFSKRDYRSVQLQCSPAFRPHFNASVGSYVSSQHQFNERLKVLAADNTEKTGLYHEYSPIDPSELRSMDPASKTTEDTEVIERAARNAHDAMILGKDASSVAVPANTAG